MKHLLRFALLAAVFASTTFGAGSGTTVLVNGAAIDPGTGKITADAAIKIELLGNRAINDQ